MYTPGQLTSTTDECNEDNDGTGPEVTRQVYKLTAGYVQTRKIQNMNVQDTWDASVRASNASNLRTLPSYVLFNDVEIKNTP